MLPGSVGSIALVARKTLGGSARDPRLTTSGGGSARDPRLTTSGGGSARDPRLTPGRSVRDLRLR
jgi:hypothetical protein